MNPPSRRHASPRTAATVKQAAFADRAPLTRGSGSWRPSKPAPPTILTGHKLAGTEQAYPDMSTRACVRTPRRGAGFSRHPGQRTRCPRRRLQPIVVAALGVGEHGYHPSVVDSVSGTISGTAPTRVRTSARPVDR
jgi:hypothetical protein